MTSKHEDVIATPSLCAGGSGESGGRGGHRGHLQRAQRSIALVVLGRLGYLLPHTSVRGPGTCYGGMKCLESSRRPAVMYLVAILQTGLSEQAGRCGMWR